MKPPLQIRRSRRPPPLAVNMILAWADAYHEGHGKWPRKDRGRIFGSLGEKWVNVDMALRLGLRSLPGGSSLARLLAERRGVRNHLALPRLSRKQILAWVDAHHQRTGCWPRRTSGPIAGARGETWMAIDQALLQGHRGLPGGTSLTGVLVEERGTRSPAYAPSLSLKQIVAWADSHHERTGKWPRRTAGPIADAPGETWLGVHTALAKGQRGLPGGSALAQLLDARRGVRNYKAIPKLTAEQILVWARAHRRRTGEWPSRYSGPIHGLRGETWHAIDAALSRGQRGMPGRSSLPQLLAKCDACTYIGRCPGSVG